MLVQQSAQAEERTIPRAMRGTPVLYVLLLALVLRVALAVAAYVSNGNVTAFHALDTGSYIQLADSLAHGKGFTGADGSPELVRTPGYPLLLVPGALLGSTELVGVLLQIAISCFTVYLVYKTGLLFFG